jgi:hypothetical protein
MSRRPLDRFHTVGEAPRRREHAVKKDHTRNLRVDADQLHKENVRQVCHELEDVGQAVWVLAGRFPTLEEMMIFSRRIPPAGTARVSRGSASLISCATGCSTGETSRLGWEQSVPFSLLRGLYSYTLAASQISEGHRLVSLPRSEVPPPCRYCLGIGRRTRRW